METNLKKGAKIKAIFFADGSDYTSGRSVKNIEVVTENGQMAEVPWFLVTLNDDRKIQINAASSSVESFEILI